MISWNGNTMFQKNRYQSNNINVHLFAEHWLVWGNGKTKNDFSTIAYLLSLSLLN